MAAIVFQKFASHHKIPATFFKRKRDQNVFIGILILGIRYTGRKISCFGKKTDLQNKIVAFCGRDRTCFQNNFTGVLSNHRVLEGN